MNETFLSVKTAGANETTIIAKTADFGIALLDTIHFVNNMADAELPTVITTSYGDNEENFNPNTAMSVLLWIRITW